MGNDHKTSQLDEIDLKIFELSLKEPGITDQEIGDQVGLCRESVLRRKKGKSYQTALCSANESVIVRLRRVSKKAASELEKLLDDPDPRIRLAAVAITLKFMPQPTLSESLETII